MDIKTELFATKIFDSNLVAIGKSKVTLKLNKTTYCRMYILDLTKVLMYEFCYNHITNEYISNSKHKLLTNKLLIR